MANKVLKSITYIAVLLFSLFCLIPFILVVSGSLSSEEDIIRYGFSLFPRSFSILSYRILAMDMSSLLNSYKITIIVTVFGTFFSLMINAMIAYAMARKSLRYRRVLSVFCMITILFNGGMVPWYIICVNYMHLNNKIIALIVPYLANAWFIFLLRNYISTIPDEMHESARMDGAAELTIFLKIYLSLSKPVLATVGLFIALMYWNDWWLGLMLIDMQELQPLQLMLRRIVANVMFMQSSNNATAAAQITKTLPTESIKMAVCVITIGPIIFLYPFVQKYFIKGIMIGAVKG